MRGVKPLRTRIAKGRFGRSAVSWSGLLVAVGLVQCFRSPGISLPGGWAKSLEMKAEFPANEVIDQSDANGICAVCTRTSAELWRGFWCG
jgi:hypothetical protein